MAQERRIYLDYNATSVIDKAVVEYMVSMLNSKAAYNSSSIHAEGRKARGMLEKARQQIADALNIDAYKDDWQIIFLSSGTEANNFVAYNFTKLPMLVGAAEHVSILDADHKNKIIIPVGQNGVIESEKLMSLLKIQQGPKLVSIMLANNETGVIQDIKALSEIIHREGGIVHCDASQAFAKIEINLNDLGCDLLTISSHKCGGPLGAAALIAKKNIKLTSMIKGGKQEQGLRAGTENLLAIGGFGVAASYCTNKIKEFKQLETLKNKMEQSILKIAPEAKIFGADVNRLPNTSSIRMPNVKSEEQLIKFDLAGISISAGSACSSGRIASSHVLKAMNIPDDIASEVVRVSFTPYTTEEDVDSFIELWQKIYKTSN